MASSMLIRAGDAAPPAIPLLSTWESNMDTYGQVIGDAAIVQEAADPTTSTARNYTYYDGSRTMFQISDYLGQAAPWSTTYQAAMESIYRDNYAAPTYAVAGEWLFPHGLYEDWDRNGDTTSKAGIEDGTNSFIQNYPFANTTSGIAQGDPGWWVSGQSRQMAYNLHLNILYEKLGNARQTSIFDANMDFIFDHVTQWSTQTFKDTNPDYPGRLAPFMVALTCEALIALYDWEVEDGRNPDTTTYPIEDGSSTEQTIPYMVKQIADFMMDTDNCLVRTGAAAGEPMWVADWNSTGYGAFRYQDTTGTGIGSNQDPSFVLNMLIAPIYAWLYQHFNDSAYQVFGDLVWEAGIAEVDGSPLSNGKQFNQIYRWSPDYVEWRS